MPQDPTTAVAPDTTSVRWGLGDAAAGWVIGLVGGLLGVSVALSLAGAGTDQFDELSLSWVALAQLGQWAGLLGVPLYVAWTKGRGPVRDFGLRLRRSDFPLGLLVGVGTQLFLIPLIYLPILVLSDIGSDELSEPARGLTDRATDPLGVTLLILIVGIGAPIIEEIFYRGLLQRAAIRRFGTWPGVVGTAVFFGVVHFQLLQLPALIAVGLVAGILALRTGRLGPAIFVHMVFNMVTVVTLVWLS